ncbi:MAG: hypothetical protein RQM90_15790 [Methanoculleus sp.]
MTSIPCLHGFVREEIERLDLPGYQNAAERLVEELEQDIGEFYRTDCPLYGDADVPVKYYLWVKVLDCEECGESIDLFPGVLVARDDRHPLNVVVCPYCGDLNEIWDLEVPGPCNTCGEGLRTTGSARRNSCTCSNCGHQNRYPRPESGPPRHRLFAIEYYNPHRADKHKGRFFKSPDEKDLDRVERAARRLRSISPRFIPEQEILPGDETDRLHRWGYSRYKELFNERQLLGLELSCCRIAEVSDDRIKRSLATNLSDLLRYQNLLCRYDTRTLKSLDIFSIHGFPVGLIQCESNFLGITSGPGTNVGSGGWQNIIDKIRKGKAVLRCSF